jgi:acyl-CoA hydrolase
MEVDLLGQCASESLGTHYISSSGGQADFVRATFEVPGGQGFIVTRATAHDAATGEVVSRIVPTLRPGAVVTAHKNRVDKIVTEFGVAELRDRTVAERVRALIAIAAPEHRDDLTVAARSLGYVH